MAVSYNIYNHIIFSQPITSCTYSRTHIRCRREKHPVHFFLFRQELQIKLSQSFYSGQKILGYFTGIHQTQARSDKQRTGTAHHQKTINTRFLHSINNGQINFDCFIVYIRIIPSRIECTDNGIRSFANFANFIERRDIRFLYFQMLVLYLYFLGMTNYSCHFKATIQCLI